MDELLVRNSGAETQPDHYLLYWRNKDIFRKEYAPVFAAFTEDDIGEYIRRTQQVCDEHKIVLVHNGMEKTIAEIDWKQPVATQLLDF